MFLLQTCEDKTCVCLNNVQLVDVVSSLVFICSVCVCVSVCLSAPGAINN